MRLGLVLIVKVSSSCDLAYYILTEGLRNVNPLRDTPTPRRTSCMTFATHLTQWRYNRYNIFVPHKGTETHKLNEYTYQDTLAL